jgi:ATP-binding cassette subfamily B protein
MNNNYEPKQPMRRLFQYLGNYSGQMNFAIASSVVNKILDLMPPIMVGWLIDTVSGNTPAWIAKTFGVSEPIGIGVFFAILIVLIFGIESFSEWLFKLNFMRLAQRVQHDLRLDAYAQLQSREIAYFENNRLGNLMAMLNDDINQLERFLNTSFNEIVQLITLAIFASAWLFGVSWQLTLIGFLPIPLIFIGSFYFQRLIGPYYSKVREAVGALSNRLENNLSGILVIKSFTAEKYETERVSEASENYRDANFNAIKISASYVPLIRMLIALGFAATMGIGAYWILTGSNQLTAGELTLFAMMIQRVLWPVTHLGSVFDEFERAKASARRIFGLMDTPNQIPNPDNPVQIEPINGNIQFQQVHFHYDNGIKIINDLNLDIKAGSTIGIAGTTGSGKTTLIKLLLRLYDTVEGKILIDNHDIKTWDLTTLRRNISLVSQDVYLFHGTIAENIAYGFENCTIEAIENAAKQAELHDFVNSLPKGYQSIVGEKGIKLSGGQRQRLSIARAILKNAPILILDEATSAVDTETERAIQHSLNHLTQGKTALIIAHRLSTLRHADKIIVLKNGSIAESGTHQQLLAKAGIYADLWNVQIGEF